MRKRQGFFLCRVASDVKSRLSCKTGQLSCLFLHPIMNAVRTLFFAIPVSTVLATFLSTSPGQELTVDSVLGCPPSDRISTVFHFSRNAKLEEIKTLANEILIRWPERWEDDERRYLLPVLVRWAELDQPGLKKFVEINRLRKLGHLYRTAMSFVEPPKSFEERLAEKFNDKVLQQWIDSDFGNALAWFEKNENRVSSSAKLIAIGMAEKDGLDAAKKWAEARQGIVSNQSALAGWLTAFARENPEEARVLALKLPVGSARQEGLQAAILGIAKEDPKTSLSLVSELGKKSDSVAREIVRRWAYGDMEKCFEFLSQSVKHEMYIDDFLASLAEQGETNEALEFVRKWDKKRKSRPKTAPITRIAPLTEILLISAPGLATEIAMLTADEKSTIRSLQALAMEEPERAIRLVRGRSGKEMDAVARTLIEIRPDLAEEFLFTEHPEAISLARSRARFLVEKMLQNPQEAGKIFQARMPDWEIAKNASEGENEYEMKESFERICYELGSSDFSKGKTLYSLLPRGGYRDSAGRRIALDSQFEDMVMMEPDPIMIELVRRAARFDPGRFGKSLEKVEKVKYRDAILAGTIDYKIGIGETHWNGSLAEVCDMLARIKTKAYREQVLRKTIVPALEKLGWSAAIEKEISESKLDAPEKKILRENLNREKKIKPGVQDPFADPSRE